MYMILLQTLMVGVPLGLTALITWAVIRRRDTTTRGGLSEDLLRLPGHQLMQQVVNEQQNLMFVMFGLGVGPLIVAGSFALQHSLMGKTPNWWLSGLLIFGLIVWLSVRLRQCLRYLSQLSTGLHAELNAGQHLNQLMRSGFHVFHDVPGDGLQHRPCGRRPHRGVGGGDQRPPLTPPAFPILNARQLATVLPRWTSRAPGDEQLKRIAHQLEQRCRTSASPLHPEDQPQPA